MSNDARWEIVRTRKGFHLRFRAGNGEPVVAGEVLSSEDDAITALLSVARGHSPVGRAAYDPDEGVLLVYLNHGDWHTSVRVVHVDERVLVRPPNPLADAMRRRRT